MNERETDQAMQNGRKCPQCGAALPAGALDGLCPACLLKQGATAETGTQSEATPFQPPSVDEVARLFPQLEILAFIGKGGMGAVYKARQPPLDRFVALKILPSQPAGGPGFVERFNREARALAKLNHPNIVAVHEFGQVNGLSFFIMEYVDGLNLRQLERAGKLSPREALQIVPQICEALQFAHDEGVVHRDIKPENILLDKKGRVKIADFGIAKIMGREPDVASTETKGAIGTPHYMAPEQVEKPQTVDHRADIYSLGVVFYEMLTGELPLGRFAAPSKKVQVDVRLDEVVLHALEKEPERRYQQASQVKTAVETIAQTQGAIPSALAPAVSAGLSSRLEEVCRQVKGAAIGLVVTGILNWIAIPFFLLLTFYVLAREDGTGVWFGPLPLAAFILGSVTFVAGLKMKRLEAYGLAIVGSLLAILIPPGNLIGLPIGIWALVALTRREVREAFGKGLARPRPELPEPAPSGVAWKVAAGIAAAAMLLLAIAVSVALLFLAIPNFVKVRTPRQPANSVGAGVQAKRSFGPVIERWLTGAKDEWFLDLDNGQTHGPVIIGGESDLPQSMDLSILYTEVEGSFRAGSVVGLDHLDVLAATGADWDITSDDLDTRMKAFDSQVVGGSAQAAELANRQSELPRYYFFRTQEGNEGVLQIAAFTSDPAGVKLRYKLVQTAKNSAQTPNATLEPADLRAAKAELAARRVNYSETHPQVQSLVKRVEELERLTREEPQAPTDLREAKAKLAELRVSYAEAHPRVQELIAKIKALENK